MVASRKELIEQIANLEAEHKRALKLPLEQLKIVEAGIVEAMDREGLTNVRTPSGTAYFSILETFHVVDRLVLDNWVIENRVPDIYYSRVSARVIRDRGQIPPGVDVTYKRELRIRES